MHANVLMSTLAPFVLVASAVPTGPLGGRDTSQDYYLKSRTLNVSSPLNNLYLSLGKKEGYAFWAPQSDIDIAFLPTIGNATARAYINGTHQAFNVGSYGYAGKTYSLGSSVFQEPDPSLPATVNIFEDGTPEYDLVDVQVKGNAVERTANRKWLICKEPGTSQDTPPTLELANSGPYYTGCEVTELVQERIAH